MNKQGLYWCDINECGRKVKAVTRIYLSHKLLYQCGKCKLAYVKCDRVHLRRMTFDDCRQDETIRRLVEENVKSHPL